MGDRNNPIKFGPEWLRNLAREQSAGRTNTAPNVPRSGNPQSTRPNGSQGSGGLGPIPAGAAGGTGSSGPPTSNSPPNAGSLASGGNSTPTPGTSSGTNTRNTNNNPVPKVQLAKMRYGREEMLALYDRTSEAPEELKYFDLIYQPRGKPPVALNTFEEEMRGGPPIGTMPQERFGIGRGVGRGAIASEPRGKSRMPFVRHPSGPTSGRSSASLHSGATRSPGFTATEEEATANRPWSASNGGTQNRTEPGEWQSKMFRRRHPSNTNWRQTSRDEGDEWRTQENARNRSNADKWDRDWNERPVQDRPQSWNSNRRTWIGDTQNSEDNLPEWAVDSAEAGAGTFDSSGAFHGYSNDDSNLPKSQETTYPLTRSHTHGSFARSKTAEEDSDEWWASEKAKKLSPKRFDAGEAKYKTSLSTGSNDAAAGLSSTIGNSNMDDLQDIPQKLEANRSDIDNNNITNTTDESKENAMRQKFSESKTFDALMRSDIDFADGTDDRGNFQSVMITPNNSLRQKHQNIVTSPTDPSILQSTSSGLLHILHGIPLSAKSTENESTQTTEDKIVEELIDMTLEEPTLNPTNMQVHQHATSNTASSLLIHPIPSANAGLQLRIPNATMQSHALTLNPLPSAMQATNMQSVQNIQNVGIQNSALNSSLGLPIGPPGNNSMILPLPLPPVMQNAQMSAINTAIQSRAVIGSFQPNNGIPVMPTPNVANNTLFLGQNNAPQLPSSSDMPLSNHGAQNNLFPIHGMQHTSPQTFGSIYSNILQNQTPQNTPNAQNLADQWYYEDPKKIIQGPFSSKEMYNWYRAGFFSPSLMVRRAYEAHMRPLGSYGPVVPFAQMDVLSPFPMSGFESRPQGYDMLNQQSSLGIEDQTKVTSTTIGVEQIQFGIHAPRIEQRSMESLWGQPGPSQDLMWMQQSINARNESSVNNLPMYFWDPQPSSTITSNSLLPEDITKDMKTEDQILAQLRASQNLPTPPTASFLNDTTATITSTTMSTSSDVFSSVGATPDLGKLQKLMLGEGIISLGSTTEMKADNETVEATAEKSGQIESILDPVVKPPQNQNKTASEKTKQAKNETEKSSKVKDATKTKNKKTKEDKKEDSDKNKDEESKSEKASVESSPIKNKKEEKQSKKELEKEKKEWIKEGFTIVKGPEKANNKETKKKAEETKAAEEAEKKKKEEEKLLAEEERKRKLVEATNKQKEQQQRQILESLSKKAPWSATLATTTTKDGLTLAEIQRLEREKKLEQIKEQQHMMQLIAQQQAAALAREQVINSLLNSQDNQNLPWSKKKSTNNGSSQSLAEIQAETRRQTAAQAAAAAQAAIEEVPTLPTSTTNIAPWSTSHNGGGFWDTQPSSSKAEKPQELKAEKKKKAVVLPPKKETNPMAEFEAWCGNVLTSWSSKIDVPTFVGFLKDIESPYEVKDYVKCYLGETKDASDFARQFLERRSKLLRVGMVTPSDDLCSPAMAVNPRSSLSDYQEVKGKGKKSKKNKMLKVDARILGFSVTASEDRINVGDIDTV